MICKNDPDYTHHLKTEITCNQLRWQDTDFREEVCGEAEANERCPQTCGVCCENDPTYNFTSAQNKTRTCKWIGGKMERSIHWCNKTPQDKRIVRDACPLACNFCFPMVPISLNSLPSSYPSSNPTSPPILDQRGGAVPHVGNGLIIDAPHRGETFFIVLGSIAAFVATLALYQMVKRGSALTDAKNRTELKDDKLDTCDIEVDCHECQLSVVSASIIVK